MLYTFVMYNASFLLLVVLLYCNDHLQPSLIHWLHISFLLGLRPKWKNMCNKWKNHFSEMKGDVGMSPHEKEGEQGDAYTKTETHS